MRQLARLAARRPGPLGALLLLPTWLLLGLAVVLYIVGVMVLAFLAVVVATLRLVLTPLAQMSGLPALRERARLRRYARLGVAELEQSLQAPPQRRRSG